MAHIDEPLHRDRDSHHHIVPVTTYLLVFAALMVLTVLTVLAATVNLGGVLNEIVALGIAVLKASLVILFFMHVRASTPLMRIVVAAGFVFFAIMVLFTMSDYVSRDWQSTPPRQLVVPEEVPPPPVPEDNRVLAPQPTGATGQGDEPVEGDE